MPRHGRTFSVVFVCTGNICRSPTAERLLRHGLSQRLDDATPLFEVSSAGTRALVGNPIQQQAGELLTHAGVDTTGFAARQLTPGLLEGVDLLLGMSREHRAAAAAAAPAMIRRVFTLREFTRLAAVAAHDVEAGLPLVERAHALVRAAGRHRGLARVDDPADDDIPDPYGRAPAVYQRSFAIIRDAVDALCDVLAPNAGGNCH